MPSAAGARRRSNFPRRIAEYRRATLSTRRTTMANTAPSTEPSAHAAGVLQAVDLVANSYRPADTTDDPARRG
jgi:hypothetical protein